MTEFYKEMKGSLNEIHSLVEEIKAQHREISSRLEALGFTAPKQKPATSLKVIQGGLRS